MLAPLAMAPGLLGWAWSVQLALTLATVVGAFVPPLLSARFRRRR